MVPLIQWKIDSEKGTNFAQFCWTNSFLHLLYEPVSNDNNATLKLAHRTLRVYCLGTESLKYYQKIAEMHKGFNNTDPIGNSYYSIELSMVAEANGSSDYFEAYAYMHQAGDFRSTSGENLFLGYKLIGA